MCGVSDDVVGVGDRQSGERTTTGWGAGVGQLERPGDVTQRVRSVHRVDGGDDTDLGGDVFGDRPGTVVVGPACDDLFQVCSRRGGTDW